MACGYFSKRKDIPHVHIYHVGGDDQSSCESYFMLPATGATTYIFFAEGVGFEPTEQFPVLQFSRLTQSTNSAILPIFYTIYYLSI